MAHQEDDDEIIEVDDSDTGPEIKTPAPVAGPGGNAAPLPAAPAVSPAYQQMQQAQMLPGQMPNPWATIKQPELPNDNHQYVLRRPAIGRTTERGVGQHIMYETGISYLAGVVLGTAYGSIEGYRKKINPATPKLRLNAVLNQSGRYATSTANTFGSFALFYSGMRSFWKYRRNQQEDIWNDIVGAGFAGFAVNLPKGLPLSICMGLGIATGTSGLLVLQQRYKEYRRSKQLQTAQTQPAGGRP